jgi:dienelactone hydrolase
LPQVLYFVSAELALGYLLFSFLSALGTLQIVAARYRLKGLAIIDPATQPWPGYILGVVLIAGSTAWFFASQWTRILVPGPAGSELAFLFGLAAACAVAVALAFAAFREHTPQMGTTEAQYAGSRRLNIGRADGRLYAPPNLSAPMPAVCLVIPPDSRHLAAYVTLIRALLHEGIIPLLVTPDETEYTYPEILTIIPAATTLLSKRPEVDPQRIGALGFDLAGDLVIRSASGAKQVKTAAALAPMLGEPRRGLDLLHEMPLPSAWRWAHDAKRASLQKGLNALEYGPKVAPRPLLLVFGARDRLTCAKLEEGGVTSSLTAALGQAHDSITLRIIPGAGHLDLLDQQEALQTVIEWFKEHL